jgi:hypothetical protein
MKSRLLVALALTIGCGVGVLYADGDAPVTTAVEPVAVPPAVSGEVPDPGSTEPLTPSMGLFPPPVVADVAPKTDAPPQLVFPSSFTPPDIAPTTSYVPAPDYTSAPVGAPAPSAPPAAASQPDSAFDSGKQPSSPGSSQASGEADFEQTDPPKSPPKNPPKNPPTNPPTPQPTPTPTPQPEPDPVVDPCADALEREWTCVVDTEAEPTDPETVEDEETLLELVPEEADGTALELVLDLRDGGEKGDKAEKPGTVIVVGTTDLTRADLVDYLEQLRETYPDAVLLSVAEPSPVPTPAG